jgi:hypothetical protein
VSDLKFSNQDKSAASGRLVIFQKAENDLIEKLLANYGRWGVL